jgi:hypothetical protein
VPEPIEGGGGTTLEARRPPFPEPPAFCWLEPRPLAEPVLPMEGGGAITLEEPGDPASDVPERLEARLALVPLPPVAETEGGGGITLTADWPRPEAEPPDRDPSDRGPSDPVDEEFPTEGGGGITFAFSDVPWPPLTVREEPADDEAETFGGGGTTSWVPNSFPMMLLTMDPLAACVGGGGTTAGAAERIAPLSRRRLGERSADGGGATTEGEGKLSFALRPLSRSGAETGGGTTATLFIFMREGETSCVTSEGAGAIIVPFSAGAERV